MEIKGFIKSTFIDWEGVIASIIFLSGCNFRCSYCHSASLVLFPHNLPSINEKVIFDFLKSKKNWIEGLVITGGEPTIYPELPDFLKYFKENLNIKIKLDTNGTNPFLLKEIIDRKLIDYVAMDIKTCLNNKENFKKIINTDFELDIIKDSIKIIMNSNIDYEFRTTISKLWITKDEILDIAKYIKGAKKYRLQKFKKRKGELIDNSLTVNKEFDFNEYNDILEQVKEFVKDSFIRG